MHNKTARLTAAVIAVISLFMFAITSMAKEAQSPTREKPIIVDKQGKRVLIYTEVNEMNVHQANVHWGVVFKAAASRTAQYCVPGPII